MYLPTQPHEMWTGIILYPAPAVEAPGNPTPKRFDIRQVREELPEVRDLQLRAGDAVGCLSSHPQNRRQLHELQSGDHRLAIPQPLQQR